MKLPTTEKARGRHAAEILLWNEWRDQQILNGLRLGELTLFLAGTGKGKSYFTRNARAK